MTSLAISAVNPQVATPIEKKLLIEHYKELKQVTYCNFGTRKLDFRLFFLRHKIQFPNN